MPDIDASIPLRAQVTAPNMLETASQFGNVRNQINQNRLFQQENRARVAVGDAYRQAIDPSSGSLDSNRLLSIVSQNPDAAFMAGDVAAAAQAREREQIGINTQQVDLALKQTQNLRSRIGALLADPNTNPQSVTALMTDLISQRVLTPDQAMTEVRSMPQDPAQLKQWLTNHFISASSNEQQLQQIFGQLRDVDAGGTIQQQAVSPITGPHLLGTVEKTLTPEAAAAPTPVMVRNADGSFSKSTVPLATYRQMAAQGPVATDPPLTPQGLTPSEATTPTQVFNPQTRQMENITRGEFAAGRAGGGQRFAAGAPLGATEAATAAATQSANQAAALQQTADQVPQRRAALTSMRDQLDSFTSGPASDAVTKLGSIAQQFGITPPALTNRTQAAEEFNKLSSAIVTQQLASLGGSGTDSKLDAAMHSNPNSALSEMGNRGVIALMLGNESAIEAKNQAWQRWLSAGHGPESYGQFTTQFNQLYDPRVFQSQYMSPEDRTRMFNNMSEAERRQFNSSMDVARQAGWITQNGQ